MKRFESLEDVWDVIDLLVIECREVNSRLKKGFDVTKSILNQIPFFTCPSHLHDQKYQSDIKRYMYCSETNVSPYKGDYNQQPYRWVEKYFIIRNAFAKYQNNVIKKAKQDKKGK